MQFPFAVPFPPFWGLTHSSPVADTPREIPLRGSAHSQDQLGSSSSQGQAGEEEGEKEEEEEDVVDLLDESETLELVQFDPTVGGDNTWEAGEAIDDFLQKYFKRTLQPEEREAIMRDFPKPNCQSLQVPRLNEEMKAQIRKAGKDPHFGVKRSLFKLQDQLVDAVGPLTCLWADLMNKDAKVDPQDTILLIQRVLVLLSSASHSITQERQKVAWSRINPATVHLLTEDAEGEKKETTLFVGGFLERAAKRLEDEKALAKVTGARHGGVPPPKRQRPGQDPNDLRRFLEKGAPAKYGGRNPQCQQPY